MPSKAKARGLKDIRKPDDSVLFPASWIRKAMCKKKHIPFEDDGISTMTELVHFVHQLTLHVLGVNNCRGLLGNSNG